MPNYSSFIAVTFLLMLEGFQNGNRNKCKLLLYEISCAQRVVVGEEGREKCL